MAASARLLRRVGSDTDGVGIPLGHDASFTVLYLPAPARDRAMVRDRLSRAGATVTIADDVPHALHVLGTRRFGLVVVDLATERTAVAAVRLVRAQFPAMPLVGLIDTTQPLVASEAIYAGATDLLPWPFDEKDVAIVFAAARDAQAADPSSSVADMSERLFEYSPAMRLVATALKAAALRRMSVLITGEAGSGRHLVARTLHERDHEYLNRPLIAVDCAAEGPNELERRLFGAPAESTPGGSLAVRATRGSALTAAQGGSLLLLNVADVPARLQVRLAQVLRDREVYSEDLGEAIRLDVRVITVMGPDADGAIADGRLRRDLFERLSHVRIDMPPLRKRREDIPLLAGHFLRKACESEHAGPKRFSRSALALLAALPWRGNAAELQAVVTAAVRASRQPVILLEDILAHVSLDAAPDQAFSGSLTLREARARFERECISATLVHHHGRVGDAARALGLQRTNLYRKIRQLNVSRALLSHRK